MTVAGDAGPLEGGGGPVPAESLVDLAGGAVEPAHVRDVLARRGFVRLRGLPRGGAPEEAPVDGHRLVSRLLGERPFVAEVQVLRPVPGARSFAASTGDAPLHTDSQDLGGLAPSLQVLACERPAAEGGESTLLDGAALLRRIARVDPPLLRALFEVRRRMPFYFGDVVGPTVRLSRGHLVLTCPPHPVDDHVGRALAPHLASCTPHVLRLEAGDVLVVDNHRVLHGRRAFADPSRRLVRVLAWMERPLWRDADLLGIAAPLSAPADRELSPRSPRLRAVLELLGGVAPATIAAREGVPEETLYAWRSAALSAAEATLSDPGGAQGPRRR